MAQEVGAVAMSREDDGGIPFTDGVGTVKRKAGEGYVIVDCTAGVDSQLVQRLLASSTPVLFSGAAAGWPAAAWSPEALAKAEAGSAVTEIAFYPKSSCRAWETDATVVEGSLRAFSAWCLAQNGGGTGGRGPESHAEASEGGAELQPAFPDPSGHWGYVSYKHMHELFQGQPPAFLAGVRWEEFGLACDGGASTFWFGSRGAHTACHYDTYGSNLVAQLHGEKHWRLFPPHCTPGLYATRIPYEESSVFSAVDVMRPDAVVHPRFRTDAAPHQVDIVLHPGDVLFVPRHWWHFVRSPGTAISVNTWLDDPRDSQERLREALARRLVCGLLRDSGRVDGAVNPGEVCQRPEEDHALLRVALCEMGVAGVGDMSDGEIFRLVADSFSAPQGEKARLPEPPHLPFCRLPSSPVQSPKTRPPPPHTNTHFHIRNHPHSRVPSAGRCGERAAVQAGRCNAHGARMKIAWDRTGERNRGRLYLDLGGFTGGWQQKDSPSVRRGGTANHYKITLYSTSHALSLAIGGPRSFSAS